MLKNFQKNIYEIFCGEMLNEVSFDSLADTFKTNLEDAINRKRYAWRL